MQFLLALYLMTLVACGTGGFIDKLDGEVGIEDDLVILPGGQNLLYRLDKGTYDFQLQASSSVGINLVGSDCRNTPSTQSYTKTCKFSGIGQLIITNPRTFGSDVNIKITQVSGE